MINLIITLIVFVGVEIQRRNQYRKGCGFFPVLNLVIILIC